VPLFDGAGVIGCGDDEPEPVVLGGVAVRLAVVGGEEPLLAVLLLFFERGSAIVSDETIKQLTVPRNPKYDLNVAGSE
jgi:hypothetical protein